MSVNDYRDQSIGGIASIVNETRIRELHSELAEILRSEQTALNSQNIAFIKSLEQVNKVRDFLGKPEHILGSPKTKHGEIAEVIEVHIRNARSLLESKPPQATFDGVGRTAPADYLINGTEVQSKFWHGYNRGSLDGIIEHMEKYSNFGRDGSYYHVPKDQYEIFIKIINGDNVEGLADKTIKNVLGRIQTIENNSGRNFTEVVKPSISEYGEVQKGVVFQTVDGYEEELTIRNDEINQGIRQKADEEKQYSIETHQPSIGEALKVGASGAVIAGTFQVGLCVYKKHKEGKKLIEYNTEDWKDIGIDFSKGATQGGISGIAIYGITNYTNMAAPMASAFVSTAWGVAELGKKYKSGDISKDEFFEQGQILCFDSAAVALGATIGQTIIPIPIVGALIGTFASKNLLSIWKNVLGEETRELKKILDREYDEALYNIEIKNKIVIQQILAEYDQLGQITNMAFCFESNSIFRLNASVSLALEYKVKKDKILKSTSDVDEFMLS